MLKKILNGNIQIRDSVENWEESVKLASGPLLERKYIKESYVDSMIGEIKKLGFYVVLREGVAMPHSRPENGVLVTSMSLLKLNTPVMYGGNAVNLIFILASVDSSAHIEALTAFSEFLQNDEDVMLLTACETIEDINKIIDKY